MQFTHPQLLWLIIPALAWTWWCARGSLRRTRPQTVYVSWAIRSFVLSVLVLAIADPQMQSFQYSRQFILIPDSSHRLLGASQKQTETFATELGGDHETEIKVVGSTSTAESSKNNLLTSVMQAAEFSPAERSSHLVLFTDGHSTPDELMMASSRIGIPVSVVPIGSQPDRDTAISEITGPNIVQPGESFEVELVLYASTEATAELQLFSESIRIHRETLSLNPGFTRTRVTCMAPETRLMQIAAQLSAPEVDRNPENNRLTKAVAVKTKPHVLLVAEDEERIAPTRAAIDAQLIQTSVCEPQELPATAAECSQYDAVLLSNIPASEISNEQIEALRQYVNQLGGGLIVCGGDRSFSAGNYANSVINELLPVDSRDEEAEDRPTRAITILIDKSASMDGEKLDMAGRAAASVVGYLKPADELSVIAFDAVPHVLIPLQPVRDLQAPDELIRSLAASGGTTLDPAIEAAFEMLARSQSSQRHIILLTDGAATDRDPEAIVSEMSASGITLSVVSIGEDANELLLESLSAAGRGRFWSTQNPQELPTIVLQDADSTGAQAILTDTVVPMLKQTTPVLQSPEFRAFPPLEGFVRTKSRSQAEVILSGADELPILAWWQTGLGTVVAFTSDIEGRWTTAWETWPPAPKFWSQIIRYAAREHISDQLEVTVDADEFGLHVLATIPSGTWVASEQTEGTIKLISADGTTLQTPLTNWDQQHRIGEVKLPYPGLWIAEAEIRDADQTLRSLPIPVMIDANKASRPREINEWSLRRIAKAGGGLYNPTPGDLLRMTIRPGVIHETAREELFCIAAMLWLIDVVVRRVGRGRGRL